MRRILLYPLFLAAMAAPGFAQSRPRPAPPPPPPARLAPKSYPLVWDSIRKIYDAKPGETSTAFVFSVTNTSADEVEIKHIEPACTCTVAPMPRKPWVLAPGETGSFTATMDFEGKNGRYSKTILVESSHGNQTLTVTVNAPEIDVAIRLQNQEAARKDRQAVFRNTCAECHATPLARRTGAELFANACGICHLAKQRAEMVPDLRTARGPRDAAYWTKWIREGKDGTLMPAFAATHGGPLSDEQILSLVEYATANLPGPAAPPAPTEP